MSGSLDEILSDRKIFTAECAEKIEANALSEAKKIWGGARANSGRKTITGKVLKFTKKLSEEEVRFIDYARSHNINYEDLMQG